MTKKYDVVPPQARFSSRFVTTSRNLVLHWLANLVIVPAYLGLAYVLLTDLSNFLLVSSPALSIPVVFSFVLVFLLGTLLVATSVFAPRHWRMGFRDWEFVVVISLCVTSPLFFSLPLIPVMIISISFIAWFIFGLVRVLWAASHRSAWMVFAVLGLVGGIAYYILPNFIVYPVGECYTQLGCWPIYWLWLTVSCLLSSYSIYRQLMWFRSNKTDARIRGVTLALIYFLLELSLCFLSLKLQKNYGNLPSYPASIGLLMMFIAGNPEHLIYRQFAYWRSLFARIRHDYLYSQFSPFLALQHPINSVVQIWLPKFFAISNYALYLTGLLFIGGLAVPITIYYFSIDPQQQGWKSTVTPLELLAIGIISTVVLLLSYSFAWVVVNRNRYVVTEFEYDHEDKEFQTELYSIAKLATHTLVDELQKIATLLKLRQVENLHFTRDDSNAFFVTSGINEELFEQIDQSVSFELPKTGKISMTNVGYWLMRMFSTIQVKGRVQRRRHDGISIWVELKYRNNQSAAVDMVVLTENSLDEIDEVLIRPIARRLALKLLIELKHVPHLGSSWETLDYFLRGLNASAGQNWWQAISFYRQALQVEETVCGSFGVGHYHLGTALLFQGYWKEGYEHLETAESDGPPMAELQYMLALALLYIYWGELHSRPNILSDIDQRCAKAITLRSNFAEAHQLRGIAYFRAARNHDREGSKLKDMISAQGNEVPHAHQKGLNNWITIDNPTTRQSTYYKLALRYYRKALQIYDRTNWNLARQVRAQGIESDYFNRSVTHRMTVAHQIGDALRALNRFEESEGFYEDVQTVFPRNIRNLADKAKMYCLAENWQKAEEFIWQHVAKYDIAAWDADIAIHVGWALCGGLYDHYTTSLKTSLDRRIATLTSTEYSQLYPIKNAKQWLGEAVEYLDYALYQRPRYLESWRQSNWYDSLKHAYHRLSELERKAESIRNPNRINSMTFEDPDLRHYGVWLALRASTYGHTLHLNDKVKASLVELETSDTGKKFQLYPILTTLLTSREQAIKVEKRSQTKGSHDMGTIYERLILAQKLYQDWTEIRNNIHLKLSSEEKVSFAGRWQIDLYYEIALLTCRTLAESESFEALYEVASLTTKDSDDWLAVWSKKYKYPENKKSAKKYYTFSPYVSRYQRATLRAWKAFAKLQCKYDRVTNARISAIPSQILDHRVPEQTLLRDVQEEVDKVRQLIPSHPLAMFVQAIIQWKSGLKSQAIEQLEQLLDVIDPFDPKRDVGGMVFGISGPFPTTNENRSHLYHMERVCGRQQFHNIINPVNIHLLMYEIYRDMNKREIGVRHLTEAIRISSFQDLNIDIFLRLANELIAMERHEEAQAILNAARVSNQFIEMSELSEINRNSLDILECVVTTRRMHHVESLRKCKEIAHNFGIEDLLEHLSKLTHKSDSNGASDASSVSFTSTIGTAIQLILSHSYQNPDSLTKLICEKVNSLEKYPSSKESKVFMLSELLAWVIREKQPEEKSEENSSSELQVWWPRIFVKLKLDEKATGIIDKLAQMALYEMQSNAIIELFLLARKANWGDLSLQFGTIMLSHIVQFVGKHSWEILNQFAELCNSLAYNRIETGIHAERYAFIDSNCAQVVMAFLHQASDLDTLPHKVATEKYAQYCDTYGWLLHQQAFRYSSNQSTNEGIKFFASQKSIELVHDLLNKSERVLDQGIRNDPTRAIIHYHLACLHLSNINLLWQSEQETLHQVSTGEKARYIDNLINLAFLEWRNAQQFDRYGRLHSQLSALHNQIHTYRKFWANRQLREITGNNDAKF